MPVQIPIPHSTLWLYESSCIAATDCFRDSIESASCPDSVIVHSMVDYYVMVTARSCRGHETQAAWHKRYALLLPGLVDIVHTGVPVNSSFQSMSSTYTVADYVPPVTQASQRPCEPS